ncbi:interleukin 17a/f2 isoform X1 [Xiphophorus couchianus]|uniref:interleukin 17a/f2 isoform X1 n=1 Tax=Xiphophorus couchianus TaxID=32473 RepID=UPI001015DD17|nr:interleukin-17A-like isoform X1 [Xiphophorus couchianus]
MNTFNTVQVQVLVLAQLTLLCAPQVLCSALWVISGQPACDSMLVFSSDVSPAEGNGNVHQRSLSPWSWRSSTAKNRIPSTIWEASCSTKFCSEPKPGQQGEHDWNSVPIHQDVLVLTRMEGSRCYNASYLSVAVGCTCVRASTEQN